MHNYCFSLGFKNKTYNELPSAKIISDAVSSDHYELMLEPESTDVIEKIVYFFDEPFADSSALPMYYVSKMAEVPSICESHFPDVQAYPYILATPFPF